MGTTARALAQVRIASMFCNCRESLVPGADTLSAGRCEGSGWGGGTQRSPPGGHFPACYPDTMRMSTSCWQMSQSMKGPSSSRQWKWSCFWAQRRGDDSVTILQRIISANHADPAGRRRKLRSNLRVEITAGPRYRRDGGFRLEEEL